MAQVGNIRKDLEEELTTIVASFREIATTLDSLSKQYASHEVLLTVYRGHTEELADAIEHNFLKPDEVHG